MLDEITESVIRYQPSIKKTQTQNFEMNSLPMYKLSLTSQLEDIQDAEDEDYSPLKTEASLDNTKGTSIRHP